MEHVTSKDSTTIGYQRSGSGSALLLVHGTTADHTRWAGVSPRLESLFTVYALDRRGRGASTDAAEYELMREAEDIACLVEEIDGPVYIVAHSYGAVCSLEAALLTPRVERMVLYEPPIPTGLAMYPPGIPNRMEAMLDAGEKEAALELFFTEVVGMSQSELGRYRQLPMWRGRIELAPTIPREMAIDRHYSFEAARFSGMEVPARLLLGGDSPPLFQRATEAVEAALLNATVAVLPGQQHIAMDTNPEMFLDEVIGFLVD
ncbi:MAG: alpha/beta hydrolase [Acidimicrobiia bacterium]